MKKAFKVTWDSESESEKEVDTANMCFMANTLKVNSEPSFDNSGVTQEDLLNAFVELSNSYNSLKKKLPNN